MDLDLLSSGILSAMPPEKEVLRIDGREVTVTNPGKVYFPETGHTKLDLVKYYLAVADGALRGAGGRPMALKRFVDGAAGQPFFQKRAPDNRPEWIRTATLTFPSGRTADEIVIDDAAGLAWVVNLGCIDLNPHPVRAEDLDHPDELRVDLDPVPGVPWSDIREVALATKESLEAVGLVGWPKTSGSRGIHVNVRIEPRWTYPEVRRAALAIARDVERRVPALATSKWWKEERHGVFLDYNQNAKDRTVASAYSIRPLPDARVSTPLAWEEVPTVEAEAFTIDTVPARYASIGDPGGGIDEAVGSLDALLELSRRHEAEGLGDAPWPPNYAKQAGEPPRVQPSRQRRAAATTSRAAAKPAGHHRRWRRHDGSRRARATPTPACPPSGRVRARRRPAGAGRPSRSWRSLGPSTRTRRWPASSAGRRAIRGPPRRSSRPTCWSTRCAAGRRPGPASESTSSTSRRPSGRRRSPWRSTTTRGPATSGRIGRASWSGHRASGPRTRRDREGLARVAHGLRRRHAAPSSPARRPGRIREVLDDRPPGPIRVVSMCAGEGRDLLEVLADHPRAGDVRGRLVELNPELAARAAAGAPPGIAVEIADAGWTDAYLGAVPADLVLACGVFGNHQRRGHRGHGACVAGVLRARRDVVCDDGTAGRRTSRSRYGAGSLMPASS